MKFFFGQQCLRIQSSYKTAILLRVVSTYIRLNGKLIMQLKKEPLFLTKNVLHSLLASHGSIQKETLSLSKILMSFCLMG